VDEFPFENPVMVGVAATNRPHIQNLEEISVVEMGGKEMVKIPILLLGRWMHRKGVLNFTQTFVDRVRSALRNKVAGVDVAWDCKHKPDSPVGAFGWIKDLVTENRADGERQVSALAEPTPAGMRVVRDRSFKYGSIEFHPDFQNRRLPATTMSFDGTDGDEDALIRLDDEFSDISFEQWYEDESDVNSIVDIVNEVIGKVLEGEKEYPAEAEIDEARIAIVSYLAGDLDESAELEDVEEYIGLSLGSFLKRTWEKLKSAASKAASGAKKIKKAAKKTKEKISKGAMEWKEALHPRDSKGRFTKIGQGLKGEPKNLADSMREQGYSDEDMDAIAKGNYVAGKKLKRPKQGEYLSDQLKRSGYTDEETEKIKKGARIVIPNKSKNKSYHVSTGVNIVDSLKKQGYSDKDIDAIWDGNYVLKSKLKRAKKGESLLDQLKRSGYTDEEIEKIKKGARFLELKVEGAVKMSEEELSMEQQLLDMRLELEQQKHKLALADTQLAEARSFAAEQLVAAIVSRAEAYRDKEGHAHHPVFLEWVGNVLRSKPVGEGEGVIALEESEDPTDVHAYYRRAINWLAQEMPGSGPAPEAPEQTEPDKRRGVALSDDEEEPDEEDRKQVRELWGIVPASTEAKVGG